MRRIEIIFIISVVCVLSEIFCFKINPGSLVSSYYYSSTIDSSQEKNENLNFYNNESNAESLPEHNELNVFINGVELFDKYCK